MACLASGPGRAPHGWSLIWAANRLLQKQLWSTNGKPDLGNTWGEPTGYIYIYVCMYVCMYAWFERKINRYNYIIVVPISFVSKNVCMYVCVYVCMYVCMYIYIYLYMYVYIYVNILCM